MKTIYQLKYVKCTNCKGKGKIKGKICPECSGRGKYRENAPIYHCFTKNNITYAIESDGLK